MENLMLIETSTELCSTAMASDGKIVSYRESDTPRSHASMTAVFADEMLKETYGRPSGQSSLKDADT